LQEFEDAFDAGVKYGIDLQGNTDALQMHEYIENVLNKEK
jgi:hypothetical protein